MGKQYKELTAEDIEFIKKQKLFFIASVSSHEVNLAPRGYDSIRVEDSSTMYMLDLPGSSNRTARDSQENGKFTLLFTAFEGDARLVRVFCEATMIQKGEEDFSKVCKKFVMPEDIIRQFFKFDIVAVESSCGMSVPFMKYEEDRDALKDWAINQAQKDSLSDYIAKHEVPPKLW